MQEYRDASNRISRLRSREAQEYLLRLKGEDYAQYRRNWERCGKTQTALAHPLQLNVELTADCNLRCQMCYRSYDIDVRRGRLALSDIETLAKQFSDAALPSLWLSGGEPLLHPDIIEILRIFGKTKPLDFWMVTNGLLLTEEIAAAVIDSGLTWLSVSIDAASEKTYRSIRGGNYDLLIKNIETFLNMREKKGSKLPFLRVTYIKMEQNRDEEMEFVRQWEHKADIIDFQTLADYHDLDRLTKDDVLNSDFVCTEPFTLVSVIPNGDLIPCCNGFYGEKSEFNIRNTTLTEYWNSQYHTQFAKAVKCRDYCEECVKCVKSFLTR